jgi:hypothetical protein
MVGLESPHDWELSVHCVEGVKELLCFRRSSFFVPQKVLKFRGMQFSLEEDKEMQTIIAKEI